LKHTFTSLKDYCVTVTAGYITSSEKCFLEEYTFTYTELYITVTMQCVHRTFLCNRLL